jgi:hypothetical protein
MVEEFEVGPWLLMHHPRRFFLSPWCISKNSFLVLRPSSTTETWKTSRMVARDMVHDEFLGAPNKSTQIRTA